MVPQSRWFMVAVMVENMKVWRLKKGYWCGALLYADYTVLRKATERRTEETERTESAEGRTEAPEGRTK